MIINPYIADSTYLVPYVFDFNCGYVTAGTWKYEYPTLCYSDIYKVKGHVSYTIALGSNVGTRFRAMFTTVDVSTTQQETVAGSNIVNKNDPAAYTSATYTPSSDGYIVVQKDNAGKTGIRTFVS